MLKWIFIVLGSFFGLILLFLAIPFVLNPFVQDADLQDDTSIRALTLDIPEAENAFFLGEKATDAYVQSDTDDKDAELALNTVALELFAVASTKKYYQQPEFSRPETIQILTELPSLNKLRYLGVLKQKEALLAHEQGDGTQAIKIALQNVKLGKLMQETQGPLMTMLVGIAISNLGHETLQDILASPTVSSHNFATAFNIEKYEPDATKNDLPFRSEYQSMRSMLNMPSMGDTLSAKASNLMFWYKPNETHNMFVDLGTYWIDNTYKGCKDVDERPKDGFPHMGVFDQGGSDILFLSRVYLTPNVVGKLLYSVVAASLNSANVKQCQSALQARNLAIAYALHAYRQDNGVFPGSLDQLVPQYIKSIPLDPFTEEIPMYSLQDRTVYSETYDIAKPDKTRVYHF